MEKTIPTLNLVKSRSTELTRKRYNRIAVFYDQMEWFIEKYIFGKWRRRLWNQIEVKKVLEIGGYLREKGLFTFIKANMIFIVPPLCITKDQIDEGLEIIEGALSISDQLVKV